MSHVTSFQIDPEMNEKVEQLAEELETSRSAAIRYLIKQGLEHSNLY